MNFCSLFERWGGIVALAGRGGFVWVMGERVHSGCGVLVFDS